MIANHFTETPEIDAAGYPVFHYEGCWCRGCMVLRAQHDSYRIENIAKVGRLYRKRRADFVAVCAKPYSGETLSEIAATYGKVAFLKRGMKEALKIFEPAMPVTGH